MPLNCTVVYICLFGKLPKGLFMSATPHHVDFAPELLVHAVEVGVNFGQNS